MGPALSHQNPLVETCSKAKKSSPVLFPSIFRFISTTDSHVYPVFLQLPPCCPRICRHVGLDKSRHVTRKESQDLLQAGSLGRIMEAFLQNLRGRSMGHVGLTWEITWFSHQLKWKCSGMSWDYSIAKLVGPLFTIAKLVNITPITMAYGTYNYSYWGL